MADQPHPEVQALLDEADAGLWPPAQGLSVESARARLADLFGAQSAEPVATVETFEIPGPGRPIPVRLYEPEAAGPHPVLVFYHGGGWVAGGLDTHDNVCAALTNRADCLTVSVDYRLAPEHPFPAGLEDAYAALEWVDEYGEKVNADPERIAVAGDSAGGNLATAVSLLARDRGGPEIAHQTLVYPAVANLDVHDFDSYVENGEGYLLEREGSAWYYDHYLDSPVHARNPYATPLLAESLADLPPATVLTVGFGIHRDEGVAYVERLADAGVDVTHQHYPEMVHGFLSLTDFLSRSEDALDALGDRLRTALHG
ncbi:alpha/beta hydrolase [Halobacteriales archaeon Cl-PHB]